LRAVVQKKRSTSTIEGGRLGNVTGCENFFCRKRMKKGKVKPVRRLNEEGGKGKSLPPTARLPERKKPAHP